MYVNGCSFTYGYELDNPKLHCWPTLLANKLGAELVNDAVSGGTNQRTLYHTIKNLNGFDLYVIAWTTNTRFTFYKSDNNFEINFNPLLINHLYQNDSFYADWGKTLYAVWYNELYAFKQWLQQIIQLQSLFKQHNKKYLMVNTSSNNLDKWSTNQSQFIESTKHLINFDSMDDSQIFDEYQEIQYYLGLIDTTQFYRWNEFSIMDLTKDFEIGVGGHILEAGHQHVADLIYKHICSK